MRKGPRRGEYGVIQTKIEPEETAGSVRARLDDSEGARCMIILSATQARVVNPLGRLG
jgi:hypothetical protein